MRSEKPATVLVVDDQPENRAYLSTVLGYAGYRVVEAPDGQHGLAAARAERPDLAIVDMVMPGMDGFDLVLRFRADPAIASTRVLLHTATFEDREVERLSAALGVVSLRKPAEPQEVLEAVAGALGRELAPVPLIGQDDLRRDYEGLVSNKLAEKVSELESLRERLERVLESVSDGIIEVDQDGRTIFLNRSAGLILGRTPEEILGRDIHALVHHHRADGNPYPADECPVSATLADARPREVSGEVLWRSDGASFPVEYATAPTHSEGRIVGAVVVFRDISERVAAAEARIAAQVAERANSAKGEFLSRMSHELRTPLNAVLGFAQVLEMGQLGPGEREATGHILSAGRHLLDLINEVLDISRIDSGTITISPEPVELFEVTSGCLELMGPMADARQIELKLDVPREIWVTADRQRLRQCLLNLVSNAVKYNRSGGEVRVSAEPLDGGRVRLSVADTGPGIPSALRRRLFSPFDRLGAEASSIEGTGLGLALTKALVEAMGGEIGVASRQHEGSTFWLELASGERAADGLSRQTAEEPVSLPRAVAERTVLYVEDNPASIRLIERLVAYRPGIRLFTAPQGSIAVDLARERRPDLVLLDLHLPDMPGERLLERLLSEPATASIPVVVISADASRGLIEQLTAAGARAFLPKPIDVTDLLRLLDELPAFEPAVEAQVPGTP